MWIHFQAHHNMPAMSHCHLSAHAATPSCVNKSKFMPSLEELGQSLFRYSSKSAPLTECYVQDAEYKAAGAELVSAEAAFASDIVLKVRAPTVDAETKLFQPGSAYATPSPLLEPGQSVLASSLQAFELESCRTHAGLNALAAFHCPCRELLLCTRP